MPLTDNSYSTSAPYARSIWAIYLYEQIDGLDTIYEIWNSCFFNGLLYANNEYLLGQSMTWEDTYLDFMAKVVTLDFVDGNRMPEFDLQARVTSYPYALSAPSSTVLPRTNGLHFYELTAGSNEAEVNIRFRGEDTNTIAWVIGVLKFKSSGGTELERLELNNHGQGDNTVDHPAQDAHALFFQQLGGEEGNTLGDRRLVKVDNQQTPSPGGGISVKPNTKATVGGDDRVVFTTDRKGEVPALHFTFQSVAADQRFENICALGVEKVSRDIFTGKQRAALKTQRLKTVGELFDAKLGDIIFADYFFNHFTQR